MNECQCGPACHENGKCPIAEAQDEVSRLKAELEYEIERNVNNVWMADMEIARLTTELEKAIGYLREGKRKFAPTTTNSEVDCFLVKYEKKGVGK
jgi:hypothetical protein